MTNPLSKFRDEQLAATAVDLLAWCDEQNRRRITQRMGRFYYVKQIDGVQRAEVLDGTDGAAMHEYLDGRLQDYAGWSESRMSGYRRWLGDIAKKGLVAGRAAA